VWDLGQPGPIVLPEEQGKPGVMLDSELIDLLIFPRPVAWPPGVSSPKKVSLMVFLSVAINTYHVPIFVGECRIFLDIYDLGIDFAICKVNHGYLKRTKQFCPLPQKNRQIRKDRCQPSAKSVSCPSTT